MKVLNTKLALSALAIAMLATPAFAAHAHKQVPQQGYEYTQPTNQHGQAETYPNGASRSGSEQSFQDGSAFNLLKQ